LGVATAGALAGALAGVAAAGAEEATPETAAVVVTGTDETPTTTWAAAALTIERPKSTDFMLKRKWGANATIKDQEGEVEAVKSGLRLRKHCLAVERSGLRAKTFFTIQLSEMPGVSGELTTKRNKKKDGERKRKRNEDGRRVKTRN
jgi:hypothetical protein